VLRRENTTRNNDVVNDAAQNRHLPNQPTYDPTKVKAKALKDLIASVPEEYRPIAKADKKYLLDATKDFTGKAAVKAADDGNWRVRGMKVTLKHYQVLGVAFMRKREVATQAPRGGILGDEMGLGKTIMMLANIVNGKSLEKTGCRTTLIVASAALVSQWRQEIAEKVYTDREKKSGIGRVKEYHATAQIKSNQELEELRECHIVLTTYTQVQKSYPSTEVPAEYTTAQQKTDWWKKQYDENRGALHRIKWHRVVLDEAHAIKNHKSLTSVACRALEAKHHWAVSGTIILNRVDEFYSTFKFLREPHTGTLKLFRQNFCSANDPDGLEKLDVFLRKFMIRRTHLDTFFHARLLDLPQPKETVMLLDFNEIERNVYDIVKARFITRINSFSKAGQLDKQYGYALHSSTYVRAC
jgi:SNF2 family DNA or RNA helicase